MMNERVSSRVNIGLGETEIERVIVEVKKRYQYKRLQEYASSFQDHVMLNCKVLKSIKMLDPGITFQMD